MLSKLTKLSEEYNVLSIHLKVECSPRTDSCFLDISAINEPSAMSADCCILFLLLLNSLAYLADPGATMTFVTGGALKPIGGHILSGSHAMFDTFKFTNSFSSVFSATCKCLFKCSTLGVPVI